MTIKKRNRTSVVCTFCKRRKVKCDKGQPCSTCIKYGNDDCIYETLGISDELKKERDRETVKNEIRLLQNKIKKLQDEIDDKPNLTQLVTNKDSDVDKSFPYHELIGNNPVAAHDDKINFYTSNFELPISTVKNSSLRRSHSPFNWSTLMRTDSVLSNLLNYLLYLATHQRTTKKVLHNGLKKVETEFEHKLENIDGSGDIKLYKDVEVKTTKNVIEGQSFEDHQHQNQHNSNIDDDGTSKPNQNLVLGFKESKSDLNIAKILSERIRLALPPKAIIWRLIKLSFNKYYFLAPLFDQHEYYGNISKLIGEQSYDFVPVKSIAVEKRIDFAHLGCLLLMLRMTFLYVKTSVSVHPVSGKYMTNDNEIKIILNNPISANYYELARQCLSLFDLLSTASIPVYQLAVYTRLYIMYAPEEGDGDRENETISMNNILLNMAVSLGLNRDPDYIFGKTLDPKSKNLSRKLWWMVYSLNIHESFVNGNRLVIRHTDFNTKAVYYEPGNENIDNFELEIQYSHLVGVKERLNATILEISDLVSTVRGDVDMKAVSQCLEYMEVSVVQGYGRLRELIKNKDSFSSEMEKLTRIRLHVFTSMTSMSVMFSYYGYYEKKDNLKLMEFYLKKLVVIIGFDLIPLLYDFLHNSGSYLKDIPVLPIIPDLLQSIHKSTLIFLSFFVRCRKDIEFVGATSDHDEKLVTNEDYEVFYKVLNKTAQLFSRIVKELIETLMDFSPTYFYAWRLTKQLKVMYELASGKELYNCSNMKKSKGFQFCGQQLTDILDILRATVKKIEEAKAESRKFYESNNLKTASQDSNDFEFATASFNTDNNNNNQHNMADSNGNGINEEDLIPTQVDNVDSSASDPDAVTPFPSFNNLASSNTPMDFSDVDKLWNDVMATKTDPAGKSILDSGYLNIANYVNVGFDDSSSGASGFVPEVPDGRSLDDILRSFLESN